MKKLGLCAVMVAVVALVIVALIVDRAFAAPPICSIKVKGVALPGTSNYPWLGEVHCNNGGQNHDPQGKWAAHNTQYELTICSGDDVWFVYENRPLSQDVCTVSCAQQGPFPALQAKLVFTDGRDPITIFGYLEPCEKGAVWQVDSSCPGTSWISTTKIAESVTDCPPQ